MSLDRARAHLARFGMAEAIILPQTSSATVELAAQALGVAPARIAKTLSFYGPDRASAILVVLAGDARIDNGAFRRTFGIKARMLHAEDVEALTGHEPGGVCPFGNPPTARVVLDTSLERFPTVFPACGSPASAIELTCAELAEVCGQPEWVTVGTVPEPTA